MRSVHVVLGLALLGTGALALLMRKSRVARHPLVGTIYFALLTVVLSSGMIIGARKPGLSMFELMTPPTFALGLLGFVAGKVRWQGWLRWHITGMGGSYIGVVTALGFQIIPGRYAAAWWVLPTLLGTLLITRAQLRLATKKRRDSQMAA